MVQAALPSAGVSVVHVAVLPSGVSVVHAVLSARVSVVTLRCF